MPLRSSLSIFLALIVVNAIGQKAVVDVGHDFGTLHSALRGYYDSLTTAGDPAISQEGGDYTEFRRWEEFWKLRLPQGKSFEDYYYSYKMCLDAANSKSLGNIDPWTEVGPKDKPGLGQTNIGQGSQPGIGPIHFLVIHPTLSNVMLCGSRGGGLFFTTNAGLDWDPAGSDNWMHVGCQYAAFGAGQTNVWYAANHGTLMWSRGIWRTPDGGITWDLIADQNDFPEGNTNTMVHKILADHTDPDLLYAATTHRLYRTANPNDANPSWTAISIPLPSSISNHPVYGSYTFSDTRYVYDFEMGPSDNDYLFATVRFEGQLSGTQRVRYWCLMRSTDGGTSWDEMPNAPAHAFVPGIPNSPDESQQWDRNASQITIETSAADPGSLHVFYDIVNPGLIDELWRVTSTSTGTWESGPLKDDIQHVYGGGHGFGVSQTNPNDVFIEHNIGGLDIGRYITYVNGAWSSNYINQTNWQSYHVDVEDFVCHPTNANEVWMANHGGLHRSPDNGITWEWRGSGLGVADIYRMADSHSETDRVMFGLFHDASVITEGAYAGNWSPEWRQLGGADGQKPLINSKEGNKIYWSSQNNTWKRSIDHGITGFSMSIGGLGDWNTEGAIDRNNPAQLYVSTWYSGNTNLPQEIRRSQDHGQSFQTISDFYSVLGNDNTVIWRILPSWSSSDHLYALHVHTGLGTRLFRTTSASAPAASVMNSWVELDLPRPSEWPADIDFDPKDPNVLYIAYGSSNILNGSPAIDGTEMLYRVDYSDPMAPIVVDLTGSSGTWTPLPNTSLGWESVVLELGSNGGIYAGTDIGIYYTNNKLMSDGTGWQPLGTGLPHTAVKGLHINYKVNKLRAGLVGRGLWEHDLWCPDLVSSTETGTYSMDTYVEVIEDLTSSAVVPPSIAVSHRAGLEVHLIPDFHASIGSQFHAFIHPCSLGSNSFKSDRPAIEEGNAESGARHGKGHVDTGNLFPNPTSGVISVKRLSGTPPLRVELFNHMGTLVPLTFENKSDQLSCRFPTDCSNGIYHLRVTWSDGTTEHWPVLLQR